MRLSALSRHSTTVGEIVNLMSVDTQKLQDMPLILHYIWSSPLIIALAMAMLWQILGPACMAGLGFMIIVLPLNSLLLAKKLRALQVFKRIEIEALFPNLPYKLLNWNFHPLEAVSRWRDSQLQVGENYSDLAKWKSTIHKSSCWCHALTLPCLKVEI